MLILSRKSNESIVIGDNIRVTVTCIRGRYVRLGIEAPDHVGIFREELCRALAPSPAVGHDRTRADAGIVEDEAALAVDF